MKSKKAFPCPNCKGKGGWEGEQLDEYLCTPFEECNLCEGVGVIEVGGEIHTRMRKEKLAILALEFFGGQTEEEGIEYRDIIKLGNDIKILVDKIKK